MWTALRPAHIPTGTKPEAADNSRVTKTGQLNSLSTEIAGKKAFLALAIDRLNPE
jgi:hypothetical protein